MEGADVKVHVKELVTCHKITKDNDGIGQP